MTNTDNASGAGMELPQLPDLPFTDNERAAIANFGHRCILQARTDASRLLAEKEGELQRMREAGWAAVAALERSLMHSTEEHRWAAADALRAALKP